MSVLITDDFSIFGSHSKNYRVVTFAKKSKHASVTLKVSELRMNNAMRLRKGTLRVVENTFDDEAIYPPRFNNYAIELNVTDTSYELEGNVDTIITTLKALNKNATITINNWNKVTSREVRHTCGSKMNAIVQKHGLTTSVQNNTKIIKV
jgi:hypothetical protein